MGIVTVGFSTACRDDKGQLNEGVPFVELPASDRTFSLRADTAVSPRAAGTITPFARCGLWKSPRVSSPVRPQVSTDLSTKLLKNKIAETSMARTFSAVPLYQNPAVGAQGTNRRFAEQRSCALRAPPEAVGLSRREGKLLDCHRNAKI